MCGRRSKNSRISICRSGGGRGRTAPPPAASYTVSCFRSRASSSRSSSVPSRLRERASVALAASAGAAPVSGQISGGRGQAADALTHSSSPRSWRIRWITLQRWRTHRDDAGSFLNSRRFASRPYLSRWRSVAERLRTADATSAPYWSRTPGDPPPPRGPWALARPSAPCPSCCGRAECGVLAGSGRRTEGQGGEGGPGAGCGPGGRRASSQI